VQKAVIETWEWDAGDHLEYSDLGAKGLSYETLVENTEIPSKVSDRMDQTILDALDVATDVPTVESTGADPLELFSDIKAMMDSQDVYLPQRDRFLILPAAAQPEFFTNDKMMSNDYVQLQLSNISEGKIGQLLGYQLIFLSEIRNGGLRYQLIDGGANTLWTCYATSKVSLGHAVGYGASRSAKGDGGIFKIQEIASEGGYFINAPFCDGAKVLLPKGVVRFTLKTKNYVKAA
jgi:hypothetical protein